MQLENKYSIVIDKVVLVWTKEKGLILNLPSIFNDNRLNIWKSSNEIQINNFKNFIQMKKLQKKLIKDLQFVEGLLKTKAIDTGFTGDFNDLIDENLLHEDYITWGKREIETHCFDLGQYHKIKEDLLFLKHSLKEKKK
jgi:hypothetical protein